jgi:hypothetical protein
MKNIKFLVMTLFMTLGTATMFAQQDQETAPPSDYIHVSVDVTSPFPLNGTIYFEIIDSPIEYLPVMFYGGTCLATYPYPFYVNPNSLIKVLVIVTDGTYANTYVAQYYGPIQDLIFMNPDFYHISQTSIEIEDRPIMDMP